MTSTVVLHPIIKALCTASTLLGIQNPSPLDWRAINSTQEYFLEKHAPDWNDLNNFAENELKGFAATDISELNRILKKEGFSIQLPQKDSNAFGVVSILDVLLNWKEKGHPGTFRSANTHNEYPCVVMESDFNVFTSSKHNNPIICLRTKSNDVAWITIADRSCEGFELTEHINKIRKSRFGKCENYEIIKFPMVDLDKKEDITWLCEMMLGNYYIAYALQQTKFKMNHEGAHVKSAVALGFALSAGPLLKKELVIDKPFYIWIERPGISTPYFIGYITEDYWKDPKNLNL